MEKNIASMASCIPSILLSKTFISLLLNFFKIIIILQIQAPDRIEHNGNSYVKTCNGYIAEEYKDSKDVKRGLYMLSIPSNFIFKCNLTEFSHVYKERNSGF